MKGEERIRIVPEPMSLDFTGRWFKFDGFREFPEFITKEFNLKRGSWEFKEVKESGIGIRVRENVVEWWGDERVCCATILQLLRHRSGYLPEVEVREEFVFKFRGFHLDIARGGVPKVSTFKRILRWLFLLKYNYFAIYLEDLFPWKKYPQIGAKRGRLTEDELREVIDYGAKLGIEVFPSLELTGHMENILTLPEFRKYSEWHRPSEGCLDLSNPEAREFAYELLNEVLDFFPSKYVHIGGDETWALGRGKSLNKMWKFEGPKLYLKHHTEMVRRVKERGKVPMMWGDMLAGMYLRDESERKMWSVLLENEIWKEVVIANWDYGPKDVEYFVSKVKLFSDRGCAQVVCPGFNNWNRYYPDFDVAIVNINNFITAAKKVGVLGFLVTAWGDDGEECLFSLLDPLLLATMEIAEGKGDWEEKWLVLSGESREVLEVRKAFGKSSVSNYIKGVLFQPRSELVELSIFNEWKEVLELARTLRLPKDLAFIRDCLELGLMKVEGKGTVSDYLRMAVNYSQLWLEERKVEGLDRIVRRFWGAAGNLELERKLEALLKVMARS